MSIPPATLSHNLLERPRWYSRARLQDTGAAGTSPLMRIFAHARSVAVDSTFKAVRAAARGVARIAPDKILAAALDELMASPVGVKAAAGILHTAEALDMQRYTAYELNRAVDTARRKFPDAHTLIVSDQPSKEFMGIPVISEVSDAVVRELPQDREAMFICAFHSDQRLVEQMKKIAKIRNARYSMPEAFDSCARYFHQNDLANRVLREQAAIDMGKFDLSDFENLLQAIETTRRIPGAYVEIGVYRGRSARCALSYLRQAQIDRQSFFLDVFEGFTYAEAKTSPDFHWADSHADTSLEKVRTFLRDYPDANIIKSNIISDPLPAALREIAVCNIDVDLYEAVRAAAFKAAPLVAVGGILVFEDAGHTPPLGGARLAVQEFLESDAARDFVPLYLQSGQMFAVRVARTN